MKTARHIAFIVVVASIILAGGVSHAAAATATLGVCAVVRPWVKVESEQHVHSYRVTRSDIAKGYVDLPKVATLKIRTNERKEMFVMIFHEGVGTLAINDGGTVSSGGNGVVNMGMSQSGALLSKTIDGRLHLPKDAVEGVYPLMLSLSTQ
jgi:hypothetical protein